MPPVSPRRRRARPVADAPIDGLLPHAEELAKAWLLALLEQAPLERAPGLLATELARDGPPLCQAVLRAIANDSDLRRLEPGGPLTGLAARTGELAGATGPAEVSRAVDALGAIVWSALRDELRAPAPDLVAELSERVTLVTEILRGAALERMTSEGTSHPGLASVPPLTPPLVTEPASPGSPADPAAGGRQAPEAGAHDPDAGARATGRREAGHSGALWVGALEDEIARSAGSPLALLLVELEDAERITAVETAAGAIATFSHFAQAVRAVVRAQDILVCETDARAWIIARDTARPGAQALGSRIAEAVGAAQPWRGAPMVASVGTAVLDENGHSALELIESAEEARFGAAATGDVEWPEA